MAGMRLLEKKARMTSRMESVEMIRTMPSRSATLAAMVLLPTPVAPPISTTTGLSSLAIRFHELVAPQISLALRFREHDLHHIPQLIQTHLPVGLLRATGVQRPWRPRRPVPAANPWP